MKVAGCRALEKVSRKSQRAFGMSVVKCSHSTISDRAAKEVALLFNHYDDVCLLHDTDKLARAATGGLVRRKNGKAVNPFQAGQFLVKTVTEMHVLCISVTVLVLTR